MNNSVEMGKPPKGETPSIFLIDPKFAHNVGMVVRLASCYGFKQVWFTGDRVRLELEKKKRLPREERMKGYKDVQMVSYDRPFDQFLNGPEVWAGRYGTPVAVEVRDNSERLDQFEHPSDAIYVFGPEDGSIHQSVLAQCHRFVIIPTRHCLNLATAVATVLYDRAKKMNDFPRDKDRHALESMDDLEDPMGLFTDQNSV